MAAIASISLWRPRDGKLPDFMARVVTAKKIHERIGGKVRVWQSTFGGQPLSVGYVIESESWEAFGQFGAKLEQDSEWRQFWADALQNVSADLLQNSVVTETPALARGDGRDAPATRGAAPLPRARPAGSATLPPQSKEV